MNKTMAVKEPLACEVRRSTAAHHTSMSASWRRALTFDPRMMSCKRGKNPSVHATAYRAASFNAHIGRYHVAKAFAHFPAIGIHHKPVGDDFAVWRNSSAMCGNASKQ